MEELAEVFQEVNAMVNEQGEQLDVASDNVFQSESNVTQVVSFVLIFLLIYF
jgi:t-SNARE complex subunit (syntaxin)